VAGTNALMAKKLQSAGSQPAPTENPAGAIEGV